MTDTTPLVVDIHTHGVHLLPSVAQRVYRAALFRTIPPQVSLDGAHRAGLHALVLKAVGDGIVTRLHRGDDWAAVQAQLRSLRAEASAAGAVVVGDPAALATAHREGQQAVILGVEGADPLHGDLDRLGAWHQAGVRVVGLVHYVDNSLGSVCMPWQRWVGPMPVRRGVIGLSAFGREVVRAMAGLGMVVDLAHADRATTLAACEASPRPVVSSHTGAAAIADFERYLSDDELRAIAATGGLVGLWPFRFGRRGAADVAEWQRHATYIADLIGPAHLAIGTDMNGVSGHMDGYTSAHEFHVLVDALRGAGFDESEVAGIVGGNFLRVWAAVSGGRG